MDRDLAAESARSALVRGNCCAERAEVAVASTTEKVRSEK
jgi:hypothetical protein